MWTYWLGLVVGLFGAMVLGIVVHGCASSIGGVALGIVGIMLLSGQAEMLMAVAGPEEWRQQITRAGYRTSTLFLTGLTVGALPIAVTLLLLNPNLQGPFWLTFGLPLAVFVFGVPISSWIALFVLSRQDKQDAADHLEQTRDDELVQ